MKTRITVSLLAFGLVWSTAVFAAAPPPEKLLPSDTLGVLTIPDYSKARASLRDSSWMQLWNDPSLKPFREKFMSKFQSDLVKPLERELGIDFSDYSGLAQGQITLAVTRNEWDGKSKQKPGFLFIMDAGDKGDAVRKNIESLKRKWIDSGKQLKTDKIRDIEFTTLIFSPKDLEKTLEGAFGGSGKPAAEADEKKTPKKVEWMVGQSDSLLILGNSTKDIEKVLIRQSGGSVPGLSEHALFASQHAAMFREAAGYGWVNLETIINVLSAKAAAAADLEPDQPGSTFKADKLVNTLGLSGLRSLAFNLKDSPDGCVAHLLVSIPESNRKGLFKALSFESKDANPPAFVPSDAAKFTRWRLDIHKALDIVEKMLVDINPTMAGVIKLVVDNAGKDKDPDFDLRKNLIANLGDDVITYEKTPRNPTLTELSSPPSLTLISSPRPEQLASALKALGSLMPNQSAKVKEREFLGRKVYSLPLPATSGPGGLPVDRSLHYAASGSYVALSTDVSMLEEYLRNSGSTGKPLRETSGLVDAAQKVGGMGTGLFGYENDKENARVTIETLKKESGTLENLFSDSPLAGRFGAKDGSNKIKDWCDFSLLPSFDRISKYFSFTVWAGTVNPDGFSFKVFTPVPPQLKK